MVRRQIRRNDSNRTHEVSLDKLSKKDVDIIKCYALELSDGIKNATILDDREYYIVLKELLVSTGLIERYKTILSACMADFEKQGTLVKNTDSEYRYVYNEDMQLSRTTDYYLDTPEEAMFVRYLNYGEEYAYTNIIYSIFFTTNDEITKYPGIRKLPAKYRKLTSDCSDVEFLLNDLDLTKAECLYLNFRFRKARTRVLNTMCESATDNSLELYPKILNISDKDYQKVISPSGKLRQYGFIAEDRSLNPTLMDVISNKDLNLYFDNIIEPLKLDDCYAPDTFSVPEANTKLHTSMLSSDMPVSILLYGTPGSGKTQYAKTLASLAGKRAFIFKNTTETIDRSECLCRLNTLLSIKNDDSIVIVDEADTLLQTKEFSFFGPSASTNKGLVNKMLENASRKAIWIVNYTRCMDESTLRRFNISYKFNAMSPTMLESITTSKLESLKIDDETKQKIGQLISKYKIPGSSVANIVTSLKSMENADSITMLENAKIVLEENNKLLNGPKSNIRNTVSNSYDSSVLNTDVGADKILEMITNAENFAKQNKTEASPENGIRVLFYGLSGTGKTEFARYISQKLGKQLLVKKCSDIISKFVGETEQNIAAAFEEAATNGQILLFDEADSFFADREGAQHSWERTQVNEFLTQMEEFPGILICTTNLRKIMDPAMLRRFHITTEFKPLNETGVHKMLEKYFGAYSFSESQVHNLASWDSVTPGDFGRLASRIRFQNPAELTADSIIAELESIQEEKTEGDSSRRCIGFAS